VETALFEPALAEIETLIAAGDLEGAFRLSKKLLEELDSEQELQALARVVTRLLKETERIDGAEQAEKYARELHFSPGPAELACQARRQRTETLKGALGSLLVVALGAACYVLFELMKLQVS
jgi:pyridoxal/pyridoxine/pyridoxamine kinase